VQPASPVRPAPSGPIAERLRHAEATLASGDTNGAYEEFQAIVELDSTCLEAHRHLAELAVEQGLWEEAEVALRAAEALDPTSHEVQSRLGWVLLQQNEVDEALAVLQRAEELAPEGVTADRVLQALAYLRSDRAPRSLAIVDDLLASDATNPQLHHYRALALRAMGRRVEARRAFERALELDPDHGAAQRGLAGLEGDGN